MIYISVSLLNLVYFGGSNFGNKVQIIFTLGCIGNVICMAMMVPHPGFWLSIINIFKAKLWHKIRMHLYISGLHLPNFINNINN
jgi:hypothetical protein